MIGLYLTWAAPDLVDEQILSCLGSDVRPFDITEEGLVLLPRAGRLGSTLYDLEERPRLIPRMPDGTEIDADAANAASVDAEVLVFSRTQTRWSDWVAAWTIEESGLPLPQLLPDKAHPDSFTEPA